MKREFSPFRLHVGARDARRTRVRAQPGRGLASMPWQLGFVSDIARVLLIVLFALGAFAPSSGVAQPEAQPPSAYSQDELDQLLAPIALYPDQLLSQVLIAATYPLEVVEAARFVRQNPALAGEALDQAIADRNWDPSVQSLTAFPQVLAMMDDKLEWMQRLGDAFLTDEARVMDTVQSLRQRAEGAGTLQSTPQQTVTDQYGDITIAPVQPDVVYVPIYDPLYVYGPWWAPAYPPWFWYPPPFYGYPIVITGIAFGKPCAISHHHWDWGRPDWRHRHVVIDGDKNRFWNRPGHPPPPSGDVWQHSPDHRRGIAYPNAATRDRFQHIDADAVRARQQFRGYDLRTPNAPQSTPRQPPGAGQPAPGTTQPPRGGDRRPPAVSGPEQRTAPATPSVPGAFPQRRIGSAFDPGISRQQAQINAERGMQSRQSIIQPQPSRAPAAAPAPRAPAAAPAPRAPATSAPPPRAPAGAAPPRGGGHR